MKILLQFVTQHMEKALFFTMAFFISTNAFCQNDYIPLIDTNRVWSVYYYPPGMSYYYHFKGSTININDTLYHNLYFDNMINHRLREDTTTKKVYIRELNKEYLLYDFEIKQGDTINYYKLGGKFVVDTIDTFELLNGIERRRWILKPVYIKSQASWNQAYFTHIHWIEGIGSITQELLRPGGDDTNTQYTMLLCCHENDKLVYMNNTYNTCYIPPNNVDNLDGEKYFIYPNPASDRLHISIERPAIEHLHKTLFISDMQGRGMLTQSFTGNSLNVSLESFSPGVYLVYIMTGQNVLRAGKVVVR